MVNKTIFGIGMFSVLVCTSVPALAYQDAAGDWQVISRSSNTAYLVDMNSRTTEGSITSVNLARVPTQGDSSDLTHSVGKLDINCRANQARPGVETIYGADGSVEDSIDDGYDFDFIQANSLDSYVKAVVCDDSRGNGNYPTIKAFIEGGRSAG